MPNHKLKDLLNINDCSLSFGDSDLEFKFLHFDSRLVEKSCGFLAMAGESLDGHDYIDAAIQNGATLIIAQKKCLVPKGITLVVCQDPLKLLQNYASWYRTNCLKGFLIGITGSVGKTSTKDSFAHLLSNQQCFFSEGNYNNFLGLPLCLLKMSPEDDFGIFEAGISTPDEMNLLGKILKPDLMILTNIYQSHMQFFETKTELVQEKLKLSNYMKEGASIYMPQDLFDSYSVLIKEDLIVKPFLEFEISKELIEKLGYGPAKSYELAKFVLQDLSINLNLNKNFNFTGLRMERRLKNGQEFLLDCYNASPESMIAMFKSFSDLSNIIFVLADMLELGEESESSHLNVLKILLQQKPKKVILFGDMFSKVCENLENDSIEILKFQKIDEVSDFLRLHSCECIALKGSRYFALEKIYQQY